MKIICSLCGTRKAKRCCQRREMAEICPLCCAGQRDETCGDCPHHVTSQRYNAERRSPTTLPNGHFIAEIDPEVNEAVNAAGELAQRGKIDQARAAMEMLLREHPANHVVHFGMGVVHAVQGNHREAITWFDRATVISPYFMEAHFNKALACRKVLDVAGAIRASRKVVEVGDPKEMEVKQAKAFLNDMEVSIKRSEGVDLDKYMESQDAFNCAYALMEQGQWEKSLDGFRAASAMNDRNAPTHGNMGICLAKLGRRAEALLELDRALEIDPRYEPARLNRVGVERMQEGQPLNIAHLKHVEFSKEQVMRERKKESFFRRVFHIARKRRSQ